MAIKLGALKIFGKGAAASQKPAPAAGRPAAAPGGGFLSRPLPLLGRLRTARQLQVLTALLAFFLVMDAAIVVIDARQGTFATVYIATVGRIRMLSQRLAKAAQQASQSNREAFKQLRQSRDEFDASMKLLAAGGTAPSGVQLPPSPDLARPALEALEAQWKKTDRNAALVIGEERNLVALGEAVRSINANNPTLLELTDEIAASACNRAVRRARTRSPGSSS